MFPYKALPARFSHNQISWKSLKLSLPSFSLPTYPSAHPDLALVLLKVLSKGHQLWDCPDSPVVKTLPFYCRGHVFNSPSGNWDSSCCITQPTKKKKLKPLVAKDNSTPLAFVTLLSWPCLFLWPPLLSLLPLASHMLVYARVQSLDFPWSCHSCPQIPHKN